MGEGGEKLIYSPFQLKRNEGFWWIRKENCNAILVSLLFIYPVILLLLFIYPVITLSITSFNELFNIGVS